MPRLPQRLTANTHQAHAFNLLRDYVESITPRDSDTVKVSYSPHGVKFKAAPAGTNAAAGWQWKTPSKELDYGLDTSPLTWCYLSASNPLVTDGAIDLVSGVLTKARAGIWGCVQSVPAAVTISGDLYYNVPQVPYPPNGKVLSVGAAGSMEGDLDQVQDGEPSVYWIYFGGYVGC